MAPADGPDWTDIAAFVVAGLAFVISILTARYAKQQAGAAIDQAADAQRSADAAHDQAISARDQAETAARQLALEQRAHIESQEPYVVVDLRPSDFVPEALMLIIENVGPTLARNVRIIANPPFQRTLDRPGEPEFAETLLFTQGIPHLPPGRRLEVFMDLGFRLFATELPRQYEVTVKADGPFGPVEDLSYLIDLNVFTASRINIKTVHQGVQELEKLRHQVEKIAEELSRPRAMEEDAKYQRILEERRRTMSEETRDE
ncbi:COG1361 family protein [Nonomuraea wenchangensis]|nr:hypothetical protein [Nonomuraea wenchangensis]